MDIQGAYSWDNISFLLEGFGMTLRLAALAIVLSFVLGSIVGVIRYAKVPVLSQVLAVIVETLRNLPLLLLILFARFGLPQLGLKMTAFWAAIAALTLFEAAMISEIVRGGLRSVEKGQIEAARSSGLSYVQTLRHVVLPQGMRRMVPPLVSQFISLLKDTSLAVIISLADLMHNANIVMGHNADYVFPILIVVALMYFVINYILSIAAKRMEARQT